MTARAESLSDPDPAVRASALAELSVATDLADAEIEAIFQLLDTKQRPSQRAAAEALCAIAAAGVVLTPRLARALSSGSRQIRWGAAFIAARLNVLSHQTRAVLIEALGSDDSDIRWAAVALLTAANAEHDALASELINTTRSANPVQRRMSLYCLRDLKRPSSATQAAVVRALRDESAPVRLAALSAARQCCVEVTDCVAAIAMCLQDEDLGVRRSALISLSQFIESDAARSAIESQRDSTDPTLRRIALGALEKLHSS